MKFITPYKEYTLVVKPDTKHIVGNEVVLKRGVTVKFNEGVSEDIKDPAVIQRMIEISKRDRDFFPDVSQEKMREIKANIVEAKEPSYESEEEDTEAAIRKAGRPPKRK